MGFIGFFDYWIYVDILNPANWHFDPNPSRHKTEDHNYLLKLVSSYVVYLVDTANIPFHFVTQIHDFKYSLKDEEYGQEHDEDFTVN